AGPSAVARALGRVPSGLFIVTTQHAGRPAGFLASFVMQASFEPPTVMVAVARERPALADLRREGRFAVSVLDERSRRAMAAFLKRLPEGVTPFERISLTSTGSGLPVIEEALAWIECRVAGEHDAGDHVVVFGEV